MTAKFQNVVKGPAYGILERCLVSRIWWRPRGPPNVAMVFAIVKRIIRKSPKDEVLEGNKNFFKSI